MITDQTLLNYVDWVNSHNIPDGTLVDVPMDVSTLRMIMKELNSKKDDTADLVLESTETGAAGAPPAAAVGQFWQRIQGDYNETGDIYLITGVGLSALTLKNQTKQVPLYAVSKQALINDFKYIGG